MTPLTHADLGPLKPRTVTLASTGKTITIAPPTEVADVKGKKKKDDEKWWLLLLLITTADIAKADKFWHLFAPASFAGMLSHQNGFSFDELSQQYTKNRQKQDDDERRAIFAAFLLAVTKDVECQAGRMARGRLPLDEWQEYQGNAVKSLYIAADAFGRGGVEFVDEAKAPDLKEPGVKVPTDVPGALGDAIVRLRRFSGALESGDGGTVTAIIRRAGLYAGPAHGVMELARRESHRDATDEKGVTIDWLEQNVLDDEAHHCKTEKYTVGCPEITDAGPAPLGTYDPPGTRTCGPMCRCHMAYSVAAPNKLSDVKPADFKPLGLSGTTMRDVKISGGRIVTVLALAAEDSGSWATIDGTHVHFDDSGHIDKGPKALMGKHEREVSHRVTAKHGKTEPRDPKIMNQMMSEWSEKGYKGNNGTANPKHLEESKKVIDAAKHKVVGWAKTLPAGQWDKYKRWENANNSSLARGSDNLPSPIKDGGNIREVSIGSKDKNGLSDITVPSSMYKVLQWRQIVKSAEGDHKEISGGNWNAKPGLLRRLSRISSITKEHGSLSLSSRTVKLRNGREVIILSLDASHPDPAGDWKTINGSHVLIGKDGRIAKGPKHLMGKSVAEVHAHGKAAPVEKAKPGYHRIERNAVGGYVGTHGKNGLEHNPEHQERLKKLGISPGYGQIHLAEDPMAMRQAYQTDAAGREGRIYSDEHHAIQKKKKHARVNDFRKNHLQSVEKSIAADPSEEAAILRLIRPTGIRQGSETDTKAKQKAYGATTMRAEHVVQENSKTALHFIGKDGVQNHIPIDDERLASELKERAKSGGKLYNTNENKVRAHLDKLAPGYLVKDLRTVVANETAEREIRGMPSPKSLPELVKARMEVATKVANKLGNTPVIALGEYINPERFSKWETSAANNEQASAIEHFAKIKGVDVSAAAKEWIGTHAKAFRENFNQRLESPKKVKAYDDETQVSGKIGAKGKQAAMALGGRSYAGIGSGNGSGAIRRAALHAGRNPLYRSDRGSFGRMTSSPLLFTGKTMNRQIALSSGRTLCIEAKDPSPSDSLALYNHNHDELGLFTDAETGSDHASSKAHAASALAKKHNTKSSHRSAAVFHREAADRAEDAGNDHKASKHIAMAKAHESAAKSKRLAE